MQVSFQISQSLYLKLKASAAAQQGVEVCLLSEDVAAVAQALQAASVNLISISAEHVSCIDPVGTTVTVRETTPAVAKPDSDLSAIRDRLNEVGLDRQASQATPSCTDSNH